MMMHNFPREIRVNADDADAFVREIAGHIWRESDAFGTIKHYLGDVAADVYWLRENLSFGARYGIDQMGGAANQEFFYGVRDCGSSIGTDLRSVAYSNQTVIHVQITVKSSNKYAGDNDLNRTISIAKVEMS